MKRAVFLAVAAVLLALLPVTAFAQEVDDDDDFLLRVNADVTIQVGETVGTLLVIDGDAFVEGNVNDLVVINGDAVVSGTVGDITVISGDITLQNNARVADVTSIRGDITRAAGATVTGDINERDSFGLFRWAGAVFSLLFWLALTVALLVAALVFAAVGGRQLREAAHILTGEAVNAIVGAVFLWVGIPVLAVLAMLTLVGIPLGVGLLLFLLPTLWFLGYITAGMRLGLAILHTQGNSDHPYAAAALGVFILQLIALVPVAGQLAAAVAGLWGSGALAYLAYRAAGGKGFQPGATSGVQTSQQATG